jgi:uridine kinase
VCDQIIQRLHDQRVVLVSQDSFYKGLTPEEHHRVAEYNFDHPGEALATSAQTQGCLLLKLGFI